ncbi:putative reverse transcriptase domain-containing protein [Tanacetum coccineum]
MSEARMREVIREQVVASMAEFMANINRGAGDAGSGGAGAGGAGADGAEVGGTEGAVGLCQWFEKLESVFRISDCKERDKVKFATATLQGRALTWWNGRIASMGIDAANGTPWTEVRKWMTEEFCPRSVLQRLEQELYNLKLKGTDIDGYTNRFHELALLCPRMVEPEQVKVEQYIRGLSKNIRGDVTSSRPTSIDEAVRMAYQLMGQIIQDKTDEVSEGEKRKGEGDCCGRGDNLRDYNRRQNQRRANAGAMTNVTPNDNETAACWSLDRKDVTCFNCNEKGHRKRDCPKLKKNGQGGNNRGAVYKLGAVDAQQDPKVVTGTFLLNNRYATALFDSGADKSFVSTNFSTLIDIEPVELDTCYDVELADGKVVKLDNSLWIILKLLRSEPLLEKPDEMAPKRKSTSAAALEAQAATMANADNTNRNTRSRETHVRERALQTTVPKSKQQCPWKSILIEGQERSPRPERSHGFYIIMSFPHPIIILSDSDVEDALSSTNALDYTPALSDYSPASPGSTSFNTSERFN